MKRIIFLLFFISMSLYSQEIKIGELKKIVRNLVKIEKSDIVSYDDLILIADNTDSIFFKSNSIKLYTYRKAPSEFDFCRTVELKFWNKDYVTFSDCQTCNEPSTCKVANEKNSYNFKIKKDNNELYLIFKNNFESRKYKIISSKRTAKNELSEIELKRI